MKKVRGSGLPCETTCLPMSSIPLGETHSAGLSLSVLSRIDPKTHSTHLLLALQLTDHALASGTWCGKDEYPTAGWLFSQKCSWAEKLGGNLSEEKVSLVDFATVVGGLINVRRTSRSSRR